MDPQLIEQLRDRTILVTGANGYLGTALLSFLSEVPCRVFALGRSLESLSGFTSRDQRIIGLECDLMKAEAWREPLLQARPDIVVHLAAHEHRHGSRHDPQADLALNAGSVLHLLETCRELEFRPKIVFASSVNLVGCPDRVPVDENFPDQPLTLFAIHKLTAERYLQHYARMHDIPSVALRFANVYGQAGSQKLDVVNRMLLNRIMHLAMTSGAVTLFGNRHCRRDFVHVSDVVRAVCMAALSPALSDGTPSIIGSEEESSFEGVFHIIKGSLATLFDLGLKIKVNDEATLAPVEWREFVADCGRMRRATGWEPLIKLREGVEQTLRWLGSQTGRKLAL